MLQESRGELEVWVGVAEGDVDEECYATLPAPVAEELASALQACPPL